MAPQAERKVRVGDGDIVYRAGGAGPTVVLLHGIGSGAASWLPTIARFQDRFRLIAWGAPGYGGSTPLAPEAPMARDFADRLAGFLDVLGEGRVHLVGHSLGALIGGTFAATWPARVARLVLASPALGHARLPAEVRAARLKDRLDDMAALGPAAMAEKRAANLLAQGASADKVEQVRRVMASVDPHGYAQAARMLSRGDLLAEAGNIKAPTLVLTGAADRLTTPAMSRELAAAIPGARYLELPGAGHNVYVDATDAFHTALAAHLEEAA